MPRKCKHASVQVTEYFRTFTGWTICDGVIVDKGTGDVRPDGNWRVECSDCEAVFVGHTTAKSFPAWVRRAIKTSSGGDLAP